MCANYVPVTSAERMLQFFGVAYAADRTPEDIWPMGRGPFIRLAPSDTDPTKLVRFAEDGIFRFVPEFISTMEWARKTYNARTERVQTAHNYKAAWARGQRCIIPAEYIYEPNYESGQAVRWRIGHANGEPMGIAGIYESWTNADGEVLHSMAMLTVNADDHPFMRRFHAPDDEKRMVVILAPEDFEGWLRCSVPEAKAYWQQWQGPLLGEPAPLPPRARKTKAARDAPDAGEEASLPDAADAGGSLFADLPPVPKKAARVRKPPSMKRPKPGGPPDDGDSNGKLF